MFFENRTDTVFVTEALRRRYPFIYKKIREMLKMSAVSFRTLDGVNNIWARDFLPVQVAPNKFTRFVYKGENPAYSIYDFLTVPESTFGQFSTLRKSNIVLDGGNVVQYGERAIVSEIVFKHNKKPTRSLMLPTELSLLLDADIIFVPVEPGDPLGHADAIVRFINEKTVLINDYSVMRDKRYDQYSSRLIKTLNREGFAVVVLPFGFHRSPKMSEQTFRKKFPFADDFNPAFGYYINFLHVGQTIVFPHFGIPEDNDAFVAFRRAFPDCNIYTIDCRQLSIEGGLVNCVTMNYQLKTEV